MGESRPDAERNFESCSSSRFPQNQKPNPNLCSQVQPDVGKKYYWNGIPHAADILPFFGLKIMQNSNDNSGVMDHKDNSSGYPAGLESP